MTGQRKPGRIPHESSSNSHQGMTQLLSLPLSESAHVSIHMYCVLFLPLINTSPASLLSIFMEILFCKAEGPGPLSLATGLVARIQRSHRHDPTSISGCELIQAHTSRGNPRSRTNKLGFPWWLLGLCSPSAGGPGQGTRSHTL